jgi:pimeloyl-ACP methyl ester carboxylesterase
VRLHYVEQGPSSGPAVILLHGYTDSSFSFSRVLPLLPPSMRVIAVDQRGHGRSQRAGDYAMDAMARDVVELMDALDVPTATVVGHSMGSFVARRAAVLAPSRVSRLVLVGAGVSLTNATVVEVGKAVEALRDPVDPAFVREFQYSTVARPVPGEFMAAAIAESHRLDAATWKAVFAGMTGYVPAEPDIRMPTLVLGGDRDAVFSEQEQRQVGERIRGARVVIVPGVGHALHWEDPHRFVSELVGFTASAVQSGGPGRIDARAPLFDLRDAAAPEGARVPLLR